MKLDRPVTCRISLCGTSADVAPIVGTSGGAPSAGFLEL
jgi:hypothetical protein